jgi:hypothetical protein
MVVDTRKRLNHNNTEITTIHTQISAFSVTIHDNNSQIIIKINLRLRVHVCVNWPVVVHSGRRPSKAYLNNKGD